MLQVLLAHAADVERHDREKLVAPESFGLLREAVACAQIDVNRDLTLRAFDAVVDAQAFNDPVVGEAADQMTRAVGRLDTRVVADRHPIPALAARDDGAADRRRGPSFAQLRRTHRYAAGRRSLPSARWAAAFRSALETHLDAIESLDERRLLLSRDARLLLAPPRRVDHVGGDPAAGASSAATVPAGAFIGAYGWLEDIELRTPTRPGTVDGMDVPHDGTDGGFIHAPGLTHAATAGVLRSGRLTHRRADPNSRAARHRPVEHADTRRARPCSTGCAAGQSLGALLGLPPGAATARTVRRRIRAGPLHLRPAHARTAAERQAHRSRASPSQESLAASDVVDGLRLTEIARPTVAARSWRSGPTDQRYIVPPGRHGSGRRPRRPAEVQAAIEELARTHDAVADVLLAESVHQLVDGNPTRAAAALDALGGR